MEQTQETTNAAPTPATTDEQIAYEAYRDHTGGKSLATGQPIPEWQQLRPDIQEAWKASASAIRARIHERLWWAFEHGGL